MSWNPCEYGFRCPYMFPTDDYDFGCSYPKLGKDVEEGEEIGTCCCDADCELMDFDSQIYLILRAYYTHEKEIQKVIEIDKKESEEFVKEWEAHCKENERRREEWEKEHGRLEI